MRRCIFAVIFAVVWILLILIPRSNIYPLPVRAVSLLALMNGGFNDNGFLLFGIIAERSIYAYRVTSLVTPIAKEKNPFKSILNSIKNEICRYKNTVSDVIPLLTGAGIILILYSIRVDSSPWRSMAALAALSVTLRSLRRNVWLHIRFLNKLFSKVKKITKGKIDMLKIITGMSAGLILSIPVSFIPYVYICFLTGGALILTAVIVYVRIP